MPKQHVEVDEAELKRQRKTAKKAKAEAEDMEEVEEDPAEAKRKRKAAKKLAAEAAAPAEEEEEEEDPAEAKRKRKAAKKAAAAAAVEPEEDVEEDPAEAKRKQKEAKKAAKAAEEANEEEDEAEAPAKKKTKVVEAEPPKAANWGELKLFLGGLPFSMNEEQLRKDFSECGEIVEIKLLMDKFDATKFCGIAFLTMADQAGFDAVMKYNGTDYAGRTVNIKKASERGDTKGAKGKGKGLTGFGDKPEGCLSIVVKGLSYEATEEDLQRCFAKCKGGVSNVKVLYDDETGKSKGVAFVDFESTEAVDDAMKLSESELKGRKFFLRYSEPRGEARGLRY